MFIYYLFINKTLSNLVDIYKTENTLVISFNLDIKILLYNSLSSIEDNNKLINILNINSKNTILKKD